MLRRFWQHCKWRTPEEPYGLCRVVPDRRMTKIPSTRSHTTSSRATSIPRGGAKDIVEQQASQPQQIELLVKVEDDKAKGEARAERSFTLGVEAKCSSGLPARTEWNTSGTIQDRARDRRWCIERKDSWKSRPLFTLV
ncbi:hypothetical protein KR084_011572 [Drosophila pseudotakahashii]|nr:hypothetical protein KR084_011572 [Drosophila pseudotakahashii]